MICGYLARSFDLLNVRDLDLIAQSRSLCDSLTLAVLRDDTVERYLGRPPVVPLTERLELVRHLRGVDEVVVHHDHEFVENLDRFTVFAVEGEPVFIDHPVAPVLLTAERQTDSWMLQDALRVDPQSSVA
ncbi:hypothetical protein GCM10009841_27980 [Microlunatus panaciterrae]|nr:hypothetical protein [Microlunatus panaciterrae]